MCHKFARRSSAYFQFWPQNKLAIPSSLPPFFLLEEISSNFSKIYQEHLPRSRDEVQMYDSKQKIEVPYLAVLPTPCNSG